MPIATTDHLRDGDVTALSLADKSLALYRAGDDYYATDNMCTQQFALVPDGHFEDGYIECSLHQARFDVRTGKTLCAPASSDLRTFLVKLEGRQILVEIN